MQEVIDEVVDRLSDYYPCRLQDWVTVRFSDESEDYGSLTIHRSDSIAVIHLARLIHAQSLLPAAFYECRRQEHQDALIRGLTYGDEVVCLSKDDILLCLSARQPLMEENTRIFKALLDFRSTIGVQPDVCVTRSHCREAVERLTYEAVDGGGLDDISPVGIWDVWLQQAYAEDVTRKPCGHCRRALLATFNQRREEAWEKLGKIFQVQVNRQRCGGQGKCLEPLCVHGLSDRHLGL